MPVSLPKFVAIGALAHAVLVTANWWAMLYWDESLIPGRLWFALGWLWLAWPILLVVTKARTSLLAVGGVVGGALAMLPSIPVIYSWTVWSIEGFAP